MGKRRTQPREFAQWNMAILVCDQVNPGYADASPEGTVNSAIYDVLARSQMIRDYADAFHRATGLSLRIAPPDLQRKRISFGRQGNQFCELVGDLTGGCRACAKIQETLQQRLRQKLSPQQMHCPAGMTEMAVPVLVGGEHVATLLGGQVFPKNSSRRNFAPVAKLLVQWGLRKDLPRLKKAYMKTPVVSNEQFRAIVRLLTMFAQRLGECTNGWMVAKRKKEPPLVTRAKDYVRHHWNDALTMRAVARHTGLSQYYFCRAFKKAVGMTFTQYVNRFRIEKVKRLIANPSMHIGDAAFAAGFQSLPHFDRVFKRYTGKTPQDFRRTLRPSGR